VISTAGSEYQICEQEDREFDQFLEDLENDDQLRASRTNLGDGCSWANSSIKPWMQHRIPRKSELLGQEVPRSVRERLSYTVKIRSLLKRKPQNEADIKECRKIWRNIVVVKIEDIGYSMGDVVYYYVQLGRRKSN